MIDKNAATPLYIQIQEDIYEQVRSGMLAPGARVPSEIDLVNRFQVSRMTARRALDDLVNRGVLFRQQGKGTFVADDVVTYGLSTMLSFSGTLRARGYAVSTRVLAQDVIPATPEAASKLKLAAEGKVALVRRLRFVNDCPAAIHTSFLDHAVFGPLLKMDLSARSLLDALEEVSGLRVAYSKDTVQATLVAAEDRGLLQLPVGAPVLQVEGVAYTANGQPLRFTRAIYRGDMFRLSMTNSGEQNTALHFSGQS
jgi:GntR family transcriptional regulator